MEKYIYNLFWMTFLGASIFGIVYFVNMHGNQNNYYTNSAEEQAVRENMQNAVTQNQNLATDTTNTGGVQQTATMNPDGTTNTNTQPTGTDSNATQAGVTVPSVTNQTPGVVISLDEKAKKELSQKIEGLIADKITMKATSKGTRVSVVKEFLNVYFDGATKIDLKSPTNYSPELTEKLKKFEIAQGIAKQDGLASEADYIVMLKLLAQ